MSSLISNYESPEGLLLRKFNTNGDGLANFNLVSNYAAPTIFKVTPEVNEVYFIRGINLFMQAVGSFDIGLYTPLAALSNGIYFSVSSTAKPEKFRLPRIGTMTRLVDISVYHEGTVTENKTGSNPVNWIVAYLDLFTVFGDVLYLAGDLGDELNLHLNDNFTTLTTHIFQAQGKKIGGLS